MVASTAERVDRLLGFLESDPDNLSLISDAAAAALEAGRPGLTGELVDRYAALAPPPPPLLNLAGLAAMREGRFEAAAACYARALEASPAEAALRFNLAWALAAQGDWRGASTLLDEAVTTAIPAAATLKVQMLHQLGEVEDALAWGAGLADRFPQEAPLLAALSAVAMDAEEMELAARYAQRAGHAPDALATLGLLHLDEAQLDDAAALFDQALAADRDCVRAQLGKGLAALARSDYAAATPLLDGVAAFYRTHLGAWIAAGWSHLVAGDRARARQRFETALAIDDTFAEAHGALAVLDALEGRLDEARRGAQKASRLDRESLSSALAKSLLLEASGDAEGAARIRQTAIQAPIGASGQSVAQVIAALARRR